MNERQRVVVIGAGICGAAIARELTRFHLHVTLIDREIEPAAGTSKANNGLVHAGYAAKPGTLKARLNVRGNEIYRNSLAAELEIPYKMIGSLAVALSGTEAAGVQSMLNEGRANGVPGLEIWGPDRLRAHEPNLSPEAVCALWAPTGGIICPYEAVLALIENAVANGAHYRRGETVLRITTEAGRGTGIFTSEGFIPADLVINAAGFGSAALARTIGDESLHIRSRHGEYHILDRSVSGLVRSVIFPVPTPVSKGTVVQPTVDGNILVGPTADEGLADSDTSTSRSGLDRAWRDGLRLVPSLPRDRVIANYAGNRAVAESEDFVISSSKSAKGLIHVAGIQSPGLAAAPAIAEYVAELAAGMGFVLSRRDDFQPHRRRPRPFREMSWEERRAALATDPLHGRVICRCETVTEAEVRQAIRGPVGARTVDGVKRRTRSGMGRCQGGFCLPRVTAILAEELGLSPEETVKSGSESRLFIGRL